LIALRGTDNTTTAPATTVPEAQDPESVTALATAVPEAPDPESVFAKNEIKTTEIPFEGLVDDIGATGSCRTGLVNSP
jgi:hypothetical protein